MKHTSKAGRKGLGNLKRSIIKKAFAPYVSFWAQLLLLVRRPLIIGITGSVGKSTTTRMVAAVLSTPAARQKLGIVGSTSRNMNDDLGLPLAVLQFDAWLTARLKALLLIPFRALALAFSRSYPRVLVLEYGTHWKGHLHRLVRIAPPGISVVTTIGPAHLERLGTLEGIVQEKSALVRAVPPTGLVVLGDDHPFVGALERLSAAPVVKVSGRGVELSREIAVVLGRHLGLSDKEIEAGIAAFEPLEARLETFSAAGITVIDDSHNANPMSMTLGLDELFRSAEPAGRRVAVLGGMGELGNAAACYHAKIGEYARSRCDLLIGVGELARDYQADRWFSDSEAAARDLAELLKPGDRVLVKGSKAVRMHIIIARLRAMQIPQSSTPGMKNGEGAR
jgi:UDP-N-acetylmuramoyl-tripeptide--D-alanyl-D-alanine ligase